MAQTYEFYRERADAAATAADQADLENVRDRELRAEKTWRGLAEQARKVSEDREKAAREKAEQRAAEAAEAEADAASEATSEDEIEAEDLSAN